MKPILWEPEKLVCTLGGEGMGWRSEKVYCLYSHENVDIFGWPVRTIMPIETLKFLYNIIAQPHIDYSGTVYDSTSNTNKDRLQKLHTRVCRLINGSVPHTSHIPMFHEINLLSLQHRHGFHKLLWCINVYMACLPLSNTYMILSM